VMGKSGTALATSVVCTHFSTNEASSARRSATEDLRRRELEGEKINACAQQINANDSQIFTMIITRCEVNNSWNDGMKWGRWWKWTVKVLKNAKTYDASRELLREHVVGLVLLSPSSK